MLGGWVARLVPVLLVASVVGLVPIAEACDQSRLGCTIAADTSTPLDCFGCDWGTQDWNIQMPSTGALAAVVRVTHTHNTFGLTGTPTPQPPRLTVQVTPQNNHIVTQVIFDGQTYNPPPNGGTNVFSVMPPPPGPSFDRAAAVVPTDGDYNGDTCLAPGASAASAFCVGGRLKGQTVAKKLIVMVAAPGGTPAPHERSVQFFKQERRTELDFLVPWDQYVALDRLGYWDDPNGFLDLTDVAFFDMDGSESVTVNDVRLTAGAQTAKVNLLDDEVTYVLRPGNRGTFCYMDGDASGTFAANEAVYYAASCGTVTANDVRVANPVVAGRGSQVRSTQSDAGRDLAAFPAGAKTAYYDSDGDLVLTVGDVAYFDSDGSNTVTVRDVVLSGNQAGSVVAANSTGLNNMLRQLALHDTYFDVDANQAYSPDDVVYLDNDGSGFASVMDLRFSGTAFGEFVVALDEDARSVLLAGGPSKVCHVDADAGSDFDPTEAVYYADSCTATMPGDVRIANPPAGQTRGSQVRGTSTDVGVGLRAFPVGAAFRFFEKDGDGHVSQSDTVFWDSDGSATVTANDIVLSGPQAGQPQGAGDPLANSALAPLAISPRYFDANGNAKYGVGDLAYLDTDGSATGTVADVRLGLLPPLGFGSLVAPGDVDTTYDLLMATHATSCKPSGGSPNTIFLQRGPCGSSAANDVRLARQGAFTDGSLQQGSGDGTTFQRVTLCTIDDNGDGKYSANDRVYLNVGAGCTGFGDGDFLFRSTPGGPTISSLSPSLSSSVTSSVSSPGTTAGVTSSSNSTPAVPALLAFAVVLALLGVLRRRLPR